MAATTPTITVTGTEPTITIDVSTTSATDTIQVWKIGPSGASVKISAGLTMSGPIHGTYQGEFVDYNVASGVSYTYFARAVDGSGNTADSSTGQTSITLDEGYISQISKTNPDTNNANFAAELLDVEPYTQSFKFAEITNLYPAGTAPTLRQSTIRELTVGVKAIVRPANDSNRAILQEIASSNAYACLRNAFGEIWFGRLGPYTENYPGAHVEVPFVFQELDFSEAVA